MYDGSTISDIGLTIVIVVGVLSGIGLGYLILDRAIFLRGEGERSEPDPRLIRTRLDQQNGGVGVSEANPHATDTVGTRNRPMTITCLHCGRGHEDHWMDPRSMTEYCAYTGRKTVMVEVVLPGPQRYFDPHTHGVVVPDDWWR